MAAPDESDASPSLEPPRLFGRRRRDPGAPETSDTAGEPLATDGADTRVFADTEAAFADSGRDAAVIEAPTAQDDPDEQQDPPATGTRRAVRVRRTPLAVPERLGAPLVGLATGVAMLALLWVVRQGCEVARGVESCGTGPGLALLVVVFALTVLVGRLLLSRLQLAEPGMTSFLAVGVTSLVAVLLLGGLFDSLVIVLVVPVLSAAAFAAAAWVGTLQLNPDD